MKYDTLELQIILRKGKNPIIKSTQEDTVNLQPPLVLPLDSHGTIPAPSIVPLPLENSPGPSRIRHYPLTVLVQIVKFKQQIMQA